MSIVPNRGSMFHSAVYPVAEEMLNTAEVLLRSEHDDDARRYADATLLESSQNSASHFAGPHLHLFCDDYFRGKVHLGESLEVAEIDRQQRKAEKLKAQSSWAFRSRRMGNLLSATYKNIFHATDRVDEGHRNVERAFVSVTLLAVLCLATALYLTRSSKRYCSITVPDANADCCTCVCLVNDAWCSAADDGTPRFFSGRNRVNVDTIRFTIVLAIYSVSTFLTLYQVLVGMMRGNWYMMFTVPIAVMLQSFRGLYLLRDDWKYYNDDGEMLNGIVRAALNFTAIFCALVLLVLSRSLRAGFRTLQFQQFGSLTTHQTTLRNYNIMFASVMMDMQASVVLYTELCVMTSNSEWQTDVVVVVLFVCDMCSSYLAYHYVRFEKQLACWLALLSKGICSCLWWALVYGWVECFTRYKARGIFVKSLLETSTFLGINNFQTHRYMIGRCRLSPYAVSIDEMSVVFVLVFLAFITRLATIFYTTLLSIDFGKNIVSSLFFDVVAVKQREGLRPEEVAKDLID